jgi:hypothetical protein
MSLATTHIVACDFQRRELGCFLVASMLCPSARTHKTMCQRYLALAQTDADETHKHASPVMNWKL